MKRRTIQAVSKATGLSDEAVRALAKKHPDADAQALIAIADDMLRAESAGAADRVEVLRAHPLSSDWSEAT